MPDSPQGLPRSRRSVAVNLNGHDMAMAIGAGIASGFSEIKRMEPCAMRDLEMTVTDAIAFGTVRGMNKLRADKLDLETAIKNGITSAAVNLLMIAGLLVAAGFGLRWLASLVQFS